MWTGLTPDVICVNTKVHSVTGEPSQSSSKLFIYIYIYIYIYIFIYIYKFTSECRSQTTPSSEQR